MTSSMPLDRAANLPVLVLNDTMLVPYEYMQCGRVVPDGDTVGALLQEVFCAAKRAAGGFDEGSGLWTFTRKPAPFKAGAHEVRFSVERLSRLGGITLVIDRLTSRADAAHVAEQARSAAARLGFDAYTAEPAGGRVERGQGSLVTSFNRFVFAA